MRHCMGAIQLQSCATQDTHTSRTLKQTDGIDFKVSLSPDESSTDLVKPYVNKTKKYVLINWESCLLEE